MYRKALSRVRMDPRRRSRLAQGVYINSQLPTSNSQVPGREARIVGSWELGVLSSRGPSPGKPAADSADDYRGKDDDQHQQDARDDEGGDRVLQRQIAEADDEEVLAEAEQPVRERLRAGVGSGARA